MLGVEVKESREFQKVSDDAIAKLVEHNCNILEKYHVVQEALF